LVRRETPYFIEQALLDDVSISSLFGKKKKTIHIYLAFALEVVEDATRIKLK